MQHACHESCTHSLHACTLMQTRMKLARFKNYMRASVTFELSCTIRKCFPVAVLIHGQSNTGLKCV